MMGGGVIELTAKNYHENILASLQLLRSQRLLSDVTVHVDYQGDAQVFPAHRVMLAASSGYFREHLLGPDSATQGKLLLSNIHGNHFSKFLDFIYTGKVEVSKDEIADVLAAAVKLDCKDLVEICGEAITVGVLANPAKKISTKKVKDAGRLHGAKRKKQPQRSHSRQSSENEVQVKKPKVKDKVVHKKRQINTLKLSFGGRKVLQRRVALKMANVKEENKLTDEENDDDDDDGGAQVGSPSKISEGKEELNLEEPGFQSDEWTCQEDEQSNNTENDLAEEEVKEGGRGAGEASLRASKANFNCNKCQRTFHYEKSYFKHISIYHGVKADIIYRCLTCQQTFANQSNLRIHEKHVHSTERQFTCDRCEKTFKRKKDVVRHQRQVHERSNLRYVCADCGKSLASKNTLALHQRTHTGLKPYECPECQAKFTQNSALKMHRRIHTGEKPFACDQCEARFTQKHMLSYHKRSHTGEKPFMCEACGKSFASKEYLRHHSNIHTGSKPYKCKQCNRCFAQRNSLHQHLKTHTGERPYSCKDCEKQFTQLNALQRHQRIHTGEKPYMCGLCCRTFTDKSTLRRHTTIHDSDTPWKTYLVVLEGNMEARKGKLSTKGKVEKAAGGREKNTATRKSQAAASVHDDATEAAVAEDGVEAVDSSSKAHGDSFLVPAGPVPLPPEWTTHGAITLVSHGNSGEITVIHTDMTPGTQIQPLMTTEDTETRVISLEASAVPLPFSIPISIAHPIPLSTEASTISLSVPTLSLPVSDVASASISETPTISTSSVLEAAASHTILGPVSESDVTAAMDILHSDIQCVTIGDEKGPSPLPRQHMDDP